jgi:hypothetical protein
MESMRRSLTALGCPFAVDFSIENATHCITLVRWLEDRKIRELDIAERHILEEGPTWNDGFQQYLVGLGCPFLASDSMMDKLSWLIGHAISLECEDKAIDCTAPVNEAGLSADITNTVNEVAGATGLQRERDESNFGKNFFCPGSPCRINRARHTGSSRSRLCPCCAQISSTGSTRD